MLSFELIGLPDPCFAWDGTHFQHALLPDAVKHLARSGTEGAFADIVRTNEGDLCLARDPLGLNKLFWAPTQDGVELASRPSRLTDRGRPLDNCSALPANSLITYRTGDDSPSVDPIVDFDPDAEGTPTVAVETIARRIHEATADYVGAVLESRPGPAIVCLSGGLDSTSIAELVRQHRDDAVAVTFDLARPGDHAGRASSDDFAAAANAARHLELTHVPAVHPAERLLGLLDEVLVAGIDWRDFNVHAALVNAGLAVSIAEIVGDQREATTVFTGDLVNEFLADYHSETYKSQTYYRLPRLPIDATRTALVQGLGTAHREIGVFGHFGLSVVQPYAVARRHFLQLGPDMLGPTEAKAHLYRLMFDRALPDSSYGRPKVRAQTGSEQGDRGVLAACIDAGVDARWLAHRFAKLHGMEDPRALQRFLRAGRYRTAIPRGDQ